MHVHALLVAKEHLISHVEVACYLYYCVAESWCSRRFLLYISAVVLVKIAVVIVTIFREFTKCLPEFQQNLQPSYSHKAKSSFWRSESMWRSPASSHWRRIAWFVALSRIWPSGN